MAGMVGRSVVAKRSGASETAHPSSLSRLQRDTRDTHWGLQILGVAIAPPLPIVAQSIPNYCAITLQNCAVSHECARNVDGMEDTEQAKRYDSLHQGQEMKFVKNNAGAKELAGQYTKGTPVAPIPTHQ